MKYDTEINEGRKKKKNLSPTSDSSQLLMLLHSSSTHFFNFRHWKLTAKGANRPLGLQGSSCSNHCNRVWKKFLQSYRC